MRRRYVYMQSNLCSLIYTNIHFYNFIIVLHKCTKGGPAKATHLLTFAVVKNLFCLSSVSVSDRQCIPPLPTLGRNSLSLSMRFSWPGCVERKSIAPPLPPLLSACDILCQTL